MKCEVTGYRHHISHTTVFPNMNAQLRTDESFRKQSQAAHHKGISPLCELPIDMVQDVPVGDEMHLLQIGNMKTFLYGWRSGDYGLRTKWSKNNELEIDEYLISCKKPFEIHRKMRGLAELAKWKATELCTFLLYTSIVVLKKFLPPKYYTHYLLFYSAVVIMTSKYHCPKLIETANDMMKTFLIFFKSYYGLQHFTSNLHNLCHIVDEVKRFGVLGNFNTYPFENKLASIKKMVRSGNMPLNQICKRIIEEDATTQPLNEITDDSNTVKLLNKINFDCNKFKSMGENYSVFKRLKTSEFRIECAEGDKWVLTTNFQIISVSCFVLYPDKSVYFYGSAITKKEPFFQNPFPLQHCSFMAQKIYWKVQNYILLKKFRAKCFV